MKIIRHFFTLLLLITAVGVNAKKQPAIYGIGFYNLENLFDTCHDEGKRDNDFMPDGSYQWTATRYAHKLANMSKVLADMGTDLLPEVGCAVIGLAEVENDRVLTDLVAQQPLRSRNYQYVHIEGPDNRGIDCALLYNPKLFKVQRATLLPYKPEWPKDSAFKTRGFLTVEGVLAKQPVTIIVCHWPSRFSDSPYRERAALQVKEIKDSLLACHPKTKVMIMGDMNDDPTNKSMYEALSAKEDIEKVGKNDMFNPWYNVLVKQGQGTLMYQGAWNLFDQIILSPNLLNKKGHRDGSTLKYWKCEIQRMPYLFQTEGKYKGGTKRTTAGGVWLDGYSDHLPTAIYLMKEQGVATKDAGDCLLPDFTEAEKQNIAECELERQEREAKDKAKQ